MHGQTPRKFPISCILLVSLSSPYVHDARSQEPKIRTGVAEKIEKIPRFSITIEFSTFDHRLSYSSCKYFYNNLSSGSGHDADPSPPSIAVVK